MSKPPTKPPTAPAAPAPKPKGPKPISKPGRATTKHVAKNFSIKPWTGEGEGEKLLIYGKSGIGKTTLAAQLSRAVFLGIDDGGRKITNPLTGEHLRSIPGIETFQDVRDALNQKNLFGDDDIPVIDTLTKVEELVQPHIMSTQTKDGKQVSSFRKFGWDGDRLQLDQMRLVMTDLDQHVRSGRSVVLLCQQGQIKVANAEGADYLEDGPFLQHRNDVSAREEFKQWADHVLRVSYLDLQVDVAKDAKAGKVVSGDATRAIFTGGAQHFTAKTRPINGHRMPPIVSFEDEFDNSLWQYVFEGAVAEEAS